MTQNHYDEKSSTVCLDGTEVKRIREGQQLTQFYVSKMVGVTTDTISRWENKRYPTIRRENALKLAEALEVPLVDILLKSVEESVEEVLPVQKKSPLMWFMFVALVLVVLFVLFSSLNRSPPLSALVTAERILPNFAGPGSVIPVQVRMTHRAKSGGVILREYFPKGWKIVQANPPASSLDNVNGVARWIIKAGDNRDQIVYLVQVDPSAKVNTEGSFQGEIVASRGGNRSAVAVQGESKIAVAPVHWVDADGNGRIDDGEMLEGSFTIEDMSGVHIDWQDLEELWDAGSYAWDSKKGKFLPQSEP
ncbi:MAG: helix-turn-helix transcriptional regulator [Desulfuromonadales bacterium]|nr:helix-turn-helix transcriptional regulator [Desulfuromonadales bacterium]